MPEETSPQGFSIEDGAYFAAGNGSGGSKADYDTWSWKQIKAAITGSAAVGEDQRDDAAQRAGGVSDPGSLWQAALDFRMAKEVLAMVGKSIREQAEALAGEDGAWRGEAATAFKSMMEPFSTAFLNHAEQLDGGPARLNPVPEQLWAAGSHLDFARRQVAEIDVHYAAEARRIAQAWNNSFPGLFSPIEYQMDNGLTYVSWNEQIVQMMTSDMRQVLKSLATTYEDTRFVTEVQPVPQPNPLGGGPGPNDFNPEDYKPDPNDYKFDPNSFDFNPEDFTPEDFGSQNPGPQNFSPASFDPSSFSPEGFTPQGFSPEGFSPEGFNPEGFNPQNPGPEGFTPPNLAPEGFAPGSLNPGAFDPSSLGGNGFTPPGVTPFQPGSGSVPPVLPFPGGVTPPSGGGSRGGLGNVQPPQRFGGGGNGGGGNKLPDLTAPDLKGVEPPVMPKLPEIEDWAAGEGPGKLGMPDQRGMSMPPAMPFAPGAGGGAAGGPERSDASGLLGGEVKPWESPEFPGLGDPQGLSDLPSDTPEKWAAGNGLGASQMPMMPMSPMAPMAPGAGGNAGGAERSDASGLLGGEVEPWEGAELPGMGDPQGVDAPAVDPQEWAAGDGLGASQMPMMPMSPMAPMAPGAGGNAGGAERSDASGLLGGEVEPWEGAELPGMGEPRGGVDVPPVSPEEWAARGEGVGAQQMPMMPMAPMSPAATAAASGSERSDASGLLGGETESWEGAELPGMGDPQGVDAPAVDPQEWAARGEGVGAQQMPMMPMAPVSPAATNGSERSDASGLLGGETEPWESAERSGMGEPQGVDAPAVAPQEWATTGDTVAAHQVPVDSADEDRVAVVRPAGSDEDTSAWDVAAAGSLLWLTAAASRTREEPEPEIVTDYALRETTPWEHTSSASARPVAEPVGRRLDASDYLPRPFDPEELPGCGGQDGPPEEPEQVPVAEEETEEEAERTSADLLKQNEDAWSTPAPKAPGVIE
ncbi:WXG100 family type VII secretion target [Allokutzneria oryzae]|uniref:WXG100 family type VII secretion target n=1 Tax=Allokutzneria oryzae TaxID=1378989 RepID=A0ABV6A755_9PSEU